MRQIRCPPPENTVISVNAASGKPTLTWDAVAGASGYEVYRASIKYGTYTRFSTVSKTEYTNTTAEAGKTYYYKVRALCKNSAYGDGAFSAIKSITCDCARPVVTISTNASSGKPYLTWDAVAGASQYEVYRASSKNGTYTRFSTVSKTEYTNTTAEAGKTYYYKVRALCKNSAYGDGAFSAVKSAACKSPASGSTTHSTVYIGATGTKYHRESCSTLKGNGRPISLSDALAQGRTACKVCKP